MTNIYNFFFQRHGLIKSKKKRTEQIRFLMRRGFLQNEVLLFVILLKVLQCLFCDIRDLIIVTLYLFLIIYDTKHPHLQNLIAYLATGNSQYTCVLQDLTLYVYPLSLNFFLFSCLESGSIIVWCCVSFCL